ncbi:MAG: hypothetical protein KAS94_09745, partial [Desulfobulbaceae bacterium]|nr:hypothetical protein [Desulfobulbaceae bacterium]
SGISTGEMCGVTYDVLFSAFFLGQKEEKLIKIGFGLFSLCSRPGGLMIHREVPGRYVARHLFSY